MCRAWLLESENGQVVAGGGITVIPWAPGPRYPGGRVAFVYNVYTEPGHRHRGWGRAIMEALRQVCRDEAIASVALNASDLGQPLYSRWDIARIQSDDVPHA